MIAAGKDGDRRGGVPPLLDNKIGGTISKCKITLCIGNTHVFEALILTDRSEFCNLQA